MLKFVNEDRLDLNREYSEILEHIKLGATARMESIENSSSTFNRQVIDDIRSNFSYQSLNALFKLNLLSANKTNGWALGITCIK